MKKIMMLLCLACPLTAQEVDLSVLKGLEAKARESSNIDLGPEQMNLVKGFSGLAGGDLGDVAQGLRRVKVFNLEFDKEGSYSVADVEGIRSKLKGDSKWTSLISVKERNGFTEIMFHQGPDGKSDGFVLLSAEPRELTVVNIVGVLDLAKVARLGGKFGIPHLNDDHDRKDNKGKNKDKDE